MLGSNSSLLWSQIVFDGMAIALLLGEIYDLRFSFQNDNFEYNIPLDHTGAGKLEHLNFNFNFQAQHINCNALDLHKQTVYKYIRTDNSSDSFIL